MPRLASSSSLLAALAGLVLLVVPFAKPVAETAMMPHRAVYDLRLAKARGSQTVTAVSGQMTFVWKDVCDGWALEYDTQMELVFPKEGSRQVAWRYSAWESDDAARLRFFLQRYLNGQKTMERRGHASKSPDGGTAVITAPERKEIALAPGTLFPGEHSRELLAAARQNERFFYAEVFDGTGEHNGLFTANAAILDAKSADAPDLDSPLLTGVSAWRINLAFFAPDDPKGTPESEQKVRYYANGVAGRIELDYGNFVVDATLKELTALDRPDCGD